MKKFGQRWSTLIAVFGLLAVLVGALEYEDLILQMGGPTNASELLACLRHGGDRDHLFAEGPPQKARG